MQIDTYEKRWAYLGIVVTLAMVGVLGFYAVERNIHPPSNVETIDSARLHLNGEFAEENLGVRDNGDGSLTVTVVAARYGFYPRRIEIPVDTPVTFRMASFDVLHGVHVPGTNVATMIVPGYVSEVHTEVRRTGEYPMFCNEFCGLGHDQMWSRLIVVDRKGN